MSAVFPTTMPAGAPHNPAGPTPPRRDGGIRRTTTIDTVFPEGKGRPMQMSGRARDLLTPRQGAQRITAAGAFEISATSERETLSLTTVPAYPGLQRLIGQRAGSKWRALLAEIIPAEKFLAGPLYQLLDDYTGASLVAGWAGSLWESDWLDDARKTAGRGGDMSGICTGFAPGASSLLPGGKANLAIQSTTPVPPLENPRDLLGWHSLPKQSGPSARRARRIDVWIDHDLIHADLHFQDSAVSPAGGRTALHEYLLTATMERGTTTLRSLVPDARILPYRECPGAAAQAQKMVGQKLSTFREAVLHSLPGILGCTHLNDVLRSLADVPQLAAMLTGSDDFRHHVE